jgi:hypothetical protein
MRLVMAAVLALAAVMGLCQQIYQVDRARVIAAPPPLPFPDWTLDNTGEFHKEYSLSFASAGTSGYPENDRVKLRVFLPTPSRGPVPSVILLHYWGAADQQVEEALARRLNDRGIAAVLMPLPYHLSRTPKGFRSGQLAVQPDPKSLGDTMLQSLWDIRRTVDFVASRPEFDQEAIGVSGTSLGSIVGSLAFALEPRIKAASFSLGGVDMARILWRSSVVVEQREELRRKGFNEQKLRDYLAPVEPAGYLQPLGARRGMIIAANHDQVIPAASTQELIEKLGTADVIRLDSGHYGGFLVQGEILRTIAVFMDAALRDKPFNPPSRLNSPTIRVGGTYNPETGLQIALGLDLWRSGSKWFAGPLVTPKGVQGYVGYQLDRQLSAGAAITGKRTTWGLYWSVIL